MGKGEPKKEGDIWAYEDQKTRIVVNRKWCKGCRICVEFCPKKVLAMEGERPVVLALDACSRCMMCEIRCPDFAIEVFALAPAAPRAKEAHPGEAEAAVPSDIEGPVLGEIEDSSMEEVDEKVKDEG